MKIKSIVAAVAAATLSGSAFALPASATIDLTLMVSGATAQSKQVEQTFGNYCDKTTATKYTIDNSVSESYAITCTAPAANTPFASPLNLRLIKEDGGSSTGVKQVSRGETLPVVLVDDATCAPRLDGGVQVESNGIPVEDCTQTEDITAQVGISDVEPALFDTPVNFKDVDQNANWDVEPVNVSTFGVVVSPGLYDALQDAQGLTNNEDIANMPSMSSTLIANIFAGNITSWDTLRAGPQGLAQSQGADTSVNLCIRKVGSGTQAQFNAFYLQNPCLGSGAKTFAADNTGPDPVSKGSSSTYPVPTDFLGFPLSGVAYSYWNDGSSDMGRCMTRVAADNRWAIGFQSLEKVKEADASKNNYKFVRVDGVTPTLENVAAGLYRNWSAASVQINKDTTTGQAFTLAENFVDGLQDVVKIAGVNAGFLPSSYDANVNIPTIVDGGVPVPVGNLAYATLAGNPDAQSPFDASQPLMPFNKGLTNPSTCVVPNYAGSQIDVTVQ